MTDKVLPEWVKPGTQLAVRGHMMRGYTGEIVTIEKVYKTGEFKVVGDKEQWSVSDKYARKSAAYRFASIIAEPITPEIEVEVRRDGAAEKCKRFLFQEAERLDKTARSDDANAIFIAAAALVAEENREVILKYVREETK